MKATIRTERTIHCDGFSYIRVRSSIDSSAVIIEQGSDNIVVPVSLLDTLYRSALDVAAFTYEEDFGS